MPSIRELSAVDPPLIIQAFLAQGWRNRSEAEYHRYYEQSLRGERVALVAEDKAGFAGYVTIEWTSGYSPFRAAGIPEIAFFPAKRFFAACSFLWLTACQAVLRVM